LEKLLINENQLIISSK